MESLSDKLKDLQLRRQKKPSELVKIIDGLSEAEDVLNLFKECKTEKEYQTLKVQYIITIIDRYTNSQSAGGLSKLVDFFYKHLDKLIDIEKTEQEEKELRRENNKNLGAFGKR